MDIEPNTKLYYAKIIPSHNEFEVLELKIPAKRIYDTYCVGVDKRNENAVLVNESDIGVWAFYDIQDAIEKVTQAEEKCNGDF